VRLGDKKAALFAFRNAVRVQPDSADAHTNVGKLLLESGRRRKAIEHLRLATQFAPDDPAPRELLKQATAE
jgi:Flp pilus assembly protein TadD